MIPGDIDLTENLDFRRVRRREIPQLPAVFDGRNKLNTDVFSSITLNSTSYTITTSNTTTTYSLDNITTYISPVSNDYELSYTLNGNTTYTTVSDISYSTYAWYDSTDNVITVKYDDVTAEYDVFGNLITTEYIPEIPWDSRGVRDIPEIPWEININRRYSVNHSIPWESNDWYAEKILNLSDVYERVKNLISYLSDKTRRFIDNYFDFDEDNSSYLTNMSHIRITDAIID